MWRPSSACLSGVVALALHVAAERSARAQACCAGGGAITPGRLALHEDALLGVQVRAGAVLGAFDDGAHYAAQPSGSRELDFEEDLFAAARVFRRGQVALLVPLVETSRAENGLSEIGGGIGDINLSLRYDFTLAGVSRVVPGIAALVGVTAPTGTPVDAAHDLLATDATGTGAWQGNVGVAFEQTFGPWLVNATEILAWRAPRTAQGVDEALAPQWTTLAGVAYTFPSEAALAVFASYAAEGSATLNGATAPSSARALAQVTLSAAYPLSDALRVQGGVFVIPPLSAFGRNQDVAAGLTLALLWGIR